jgi:hypothetical protein
MTYAVSFHRFIALVLYVLDGIFSLSSTLLPFAALLFPVFVRFPQIFTFFLHYSTLSNISLVFSSSFINFFDIVLNRIPSTFLYVHRLCWYLSANMYKVLSSLWFSPFNLIFVSVSFFALFY